MTSRCTHLAIAAVVLLTALPLVVNPHLHLRADAMSNTALARAVLRHGIPPRDPYIAGQPLHYHWAYNAAVGWLSALTGASPLSIMVVLGPVGLAVLLISVARLVRWLGGDDGAAALAVVLVAVGLNGWGWVILLVRVVAGAATLEGALRHGVAPFLRSVVCGFDSRLGFFVTKALVATPFIWTLASLGVATSALLRFMRDGKRRHGAIFAIAAAVAAYTNLLVGAAVVALMAAGLAAWGWNARREPQVARRALGGIGLAAAGGLLAVPYLLVTVGAAASRERLVWLAPPDAFHALGVGVALLPLWALAALAGPPRGWRRGEGWLGFVALGLAAVGLVLRAVERVEGKFLFVLAVVLAIYVAGRLSKASRAVWLLALPAVPTTVLGLVAYAQAPDPIHLSESEAATFEWIAENTPRDTVVVARGRSTLVPILSDRDLYIPDVVGFHRAARYDPAVWEARAEQMRRLYGRGEMAAVLGEIARELGRPVVLITRPMFTRVAEPRLRLLHDAGDLRTWALDQKP